MNVLLTDEEIKGKWHTTIYEPRDNEVNYSLEEVRQKAKAQLKKVVEEQLKPCITFEGNGVVEFELDEEVWQSLLEEVKYG